MRIQTKREQISFDPLLICIGGGFLTRSYKDFENPVKEAEEERPREEAESRLQQQISPVHRPTAAALPAAGTKRKTA